MKSATASMRTFGMQVTLATVVVAALFPLVITVHNDFHNVGHSALWSIAVLFFIERVHGVRRPVRCPRSVPRAFAPSERAA